MKDDRLLFLILFISCQSQNGDLPSFFQHENQNCHPSLSQKDMLYSTVQSQLHDILEHGTNTKYEQPNADTVIMDDTTMINVWFSKNSRAAKCLTVMPLSWLYIILSSMLENTPDMILYLVYITRTIWKVRHGRKEEQLVTSDLSNYGTTSLDVMTAKAKIFGFLAVKRKLAQTNAHKVVIKGDGIVWGLQ